ncbi:MAG: DUF1015 domain-containing protein [Deltaproteobacteria bacterium]|nr:DUF1015 domain-containing protein [Deltaproteobacteria bacterium]
MSDIKAFKGIRPIADKVAQIASPPYDVLSSKEAAEMARNNPISFLHVVKPEIDLADDVDPYSDVVYATGKKNLEKLISDGMMKQDAAPCLYLYRQIMNIHGKEHVQTGLVAGVSVAEYEQGLIKKHEFTRVAKEADRTRHVETLNAQTGPVFLTYRAQDNIDTLMQSLTQRSPVYDFVAADGIRHIFWVIDEGAQIEQLVGAFSKVPCLYVADGHHRSASASTVGRKRRESNPNHNGTEPYNHFLAVIFPHDQMMILDYNRLLFDLNGLSPDAFLLKVAEKFEVTKTDAKKPNAEHVFGMYLDNQWYQLTAREGTFDANDPVQRLDVAILQNNLLAPVLGIGDPRTDDRIDFVGGIRGPEELERRVAAEGAVAFTMFPTPIEQLMAIADAGQVMPPKSTWFEPKLRSGMVVKPL